MPVRTGSKIQHINPDGSAGQQAPQPKASNNLPQPVPFNKDGPNANRRSPVRERSGGTLASDRQYDNQDYQ